MKSPQTSTAVNAMKPVAASGGSIVANFDVLDDGEDAAGRTGARLLNLAIVALGLGVIGALAFAWSNADGRLRFELQSAATAPKSAQRAAAPQEIERLRNELDALTNDVKELTETQHQAAHTIAAMKAAEEDLQRHVPPPYWYSNPATLDLAIANQPQWAGVAPPPGDRALRVARSAQARGRCASIAGVSAVTTRADPWSKHRLQDSIEIVAHDQHAMHEPYFEGRSQIRTSLTARLAPQQPRRRAA